MHRKAHLLVSLDINPKAKGTWFYRLDWDCGYVVESGFASKTEAVRNAGTVLDAKNLSACDLNEWSI